MSRDAEIVGRAGAGPSQALRKLVIVASVLLAFVFLIVAASEWEDGSATHESIEWAGIALIVIVTAWRLLGMARRSPEPTAGDKAAS